MLATRALRPLASLTTRRPLSQLVVSVVGPDRGGLVSSVTRAIAAHELPLQLNTFAAPTHCAILVNFFFPGLAKQTH